ncbi:MAG: prepilin-type N-terminal cleavage/methylation domain-containing protein, partial [Deltaproteobacteria bacterium]|nr:prepilin-type N-terminal cleavage/methylation domain-containing protein [Deltaproteobacteria bacterium]
MNKGVTLIELIISLAIASILILGLYSVNSISAKTSKQTRENWYCMASIRNSILQLDLDLMQCAYLMPQDMKISTEKNQLFIAGLPHTSKHSGIRLNMNTLPPYFSIIIKSEGSCIKLDTIDIDNNSVPDFWADLGIITDSGPYVISHNYSRGNSRLPLTSKVNVNPGDRVIPAIHYELKSDGLYRDGQLLAEAITGFDAKINSGNLAIHLKASLNNTVKELCYE